MIVVSISVNTLIQMPLAAVYFPITCPNKAGFCFSSSCISAASNTFRILDSMAGLRDVIQV